MHGQVRSLLRVDAGRPFKKLSGVQSPAVGGIGVHGPDVHAIRGGGSAQHPQHLADRLLNIAPRHGKQNLGRPAGGLKQVVPHGQRRLHGVALAFVRGQPQKAPRQPRPVQHGFARHAQP